MNTQYIAARTAPPVTLPPTTTDFARLSTRSILHHQFVGTQWYLMLFVAFLLLCVCFLIAGLTLGVCGLDTRWLEMRSLTGTPKERYVRAIFMTERSLILGRQQALVILRLIRHHSWMLCKYNCLQILRLLISCFRLIDPMLRCLRRISTIRHRRLVWHATEMGPDSHLYLTSCCLRRNHTTMAHTSKSSFVGLLLLASDMGMYVAHSCNQLPYRLVS